jgi:eukaryotic-like serine/threonine-protein kinase
MSSSTTRPLLDPAGATVALEQVSARVDSLIGAWESPERPPTLSKFLPDQPLEFRRLVLTELIKVDLEYRWQQHGLPKTIEEYLAEFPELAEAGKLPCDLIYEEYLIRRRTAQPPDGAEYLRRFPAQAEQLRRMLDLPADQTTTMAVGRRRPPGDIGNQIDDFDVLLRLGEGAFAAVYLARQRSMQRLVALKVSRDHGSETVTLAQLDHENIVRVFDQRVLSAERLRLMYMQHIPGGTLQDVIQAARATPTTTWNGKTFVSSIDAALAKHGEAPQDTLSRRRLRTASWAETVCWIGAQLAWALDYAHRRGVLHRDVKPANVLLAADGVPKLADFNVSFSSKLDGATPAAYFGGSLAYMSPEQLEASNPDHDRQPDELDGRSDIYSLAVMLWELLTGMRPFGDEKVAANMAETLKQLAERRRAGVPQAAIAALPRDLPEGLDQILLACLSPNPADRPATGADVARQFELCLQPRARRLMRPRAGTMRQRMRDYPIGVFVVAGIIPHIVFSIISIAINFFLVIQWLGPGAFEIFKIQIATVNPVAYTLGIGIGVYLVWPVIRAVRGYRRGKPPDPASLPALRRRNLVIGDYLTWLGFALWFLSGFVFPTWLHATGHYDPLKTKDYEYFFLSQVICGLIASTQTFFMLTFVSVRGFHPLLLQLDQTDPGEVDRLIRLSRRGYWYLGLAVAAPLIAIVVLGMIRLPGLDGINWPTIGLALIGIVNSFLVWKLLQAIQGDIAALAAAVDRERAASQSGLDTLDSFWASSSR